MYQDIEKCDFCGSVMLIHHNEGVTCYECSRVSFSNLQPQSVVTKRPLNFEKIKSCEEVIKEITNRIGISECVIDRTIILLGEVKQIFKSKSIGDLVLICMYQAYREKRMFISFYRLKEYYSTSSSVSTLNNLFHNLISSNIFDITQPYTFVEIVESLTAYFRIPISFVNLIESSYNDVTRVLKYDSIPIKIGCAVQMLSTRNVFCGCLCVYKMLNFLCVKKSTISVKLRKYKKLGNSK